jgi:hypothetical protein
MEPPKKLPVEEGKMHFVIAFITCLPHSPCTIVFPAPYMDFASYRECEPYANMFDIPDFRRPGRQITCIEGKGMQFRWTRD